MDSVLVRINALRLPSELLTLESLMFELQRPAVFGHSADDVVGHAVRMRSSPRILHLRRAHHLIAEVAGKILRRAQINLPA